MIRAFVFLRVQGLGFHLCIGRARYKEMHREREDAKGLGT